MTASLTIVAGALAWLALISSAPGYLDVLPAPLVLGAALGTAMTPSTTAITSRSPATSKGLLPPERALALAASGD
jgi:hypothetical protein